jgi:hypothetical protein
MLVWLAEPELIGELRSFLERLGCDVRPAGEAGLLVSIPRSPVARAARLELDLYLRLWEATHSEAPAALVT